MLAIYERFRDKELIYKALYKSAFFTFFTLWQCTHCVYMACISMSYMADAAAQWTEGWLSSTVVNHTIVTDTKSYVVSS